MVVETIGVIGVINTILELLGHSRLCRLNCHQRSAAWRSGGLPKHKTVNQAPKFVRSTNVQFTTSAPITPNRCYLLPLFVRPVVCRLSVGKKHTLLQALVCVLALCGLQMCVLVRWIICSI